MANDNIPLYLHKINSLDYTLHEIDHLSRILSDAICDVGETLNLDRSEIALIEKLHVLTNQIYRLSRSHLCPQSTSTH